MTHAATVASHGAPAPGPHPARLGDRHVRSVHAAVHPRRRVAALHGRPARHQVLAARSDRRPQLQPARSRLALQDRQPRHAARIQARRHAAHGRRHALHDRRHAPLGGGARRPERRAAVGAPVSRRRPRRGGAAAAVGPRRGVLDRWPRRRAHPLCHSGLPPDRAQRENRRARAVLRQRRCRGPEGRRRVRRRETDRSRERRDRPPLHADRRQGHHHRGLVDEGRHDHRDPQQHQGAGARLRRPHRQAAVDVQHDPAARRTRQRHVAERIVGRQRQHRRVDADHRRRGAGSRLPAGGIPLVRLLRRQASREQPVWREPGVRGPQDRAAQVALPAGAPPDLGSRHLVGTDPPRRDDRREAAQAGGAAVEADVPLRLRSRHRRTRLADRRDAGPARRRAGRVVRAHAADSHQADAVRPAGPEDPRRDHRLHAGAARAGDGEPEALQVGRQLPLQRHALQPAHRGQRQRPARGDQSRQRGRRHQLAGRRRRSRDGHRVCAGQPLGVHPRVGGASTSRVLRPSLSGRRRRAAIPPARGGRHGHLRRRQAKRRRRNTSTGRGRRRTTGLQHRRRLVAGEAALRRARRPSTCGTGE